MADVLSKVSLHDEKVEIEGLDVSIHECTP